MFFGNLPQFFSVYELLIYVSAQLYLPTDAPVRTIRILHFTFSHVKMYLSRVSHSSDEPHSLVFAAVQYFIEWVFHIDFTATKGDLTYFRFFLLL